MDDNPRIQWLLEEILESDRTPEDVCTDYPELLWEVRERLQHYRRVEAQVKALFPSPVPSPGAADDDRTEPSPVAINDLPQVPGYEVQAVLGRGGMGVVYKARHLALNRTVALKMILSGPYAGRDELSRFRREAEAGANLRHPHIVQVYDVGDIEGRPYFTME